VSLFPLVTSVELSTVVAGNHSKVNGTISVLSELLVWKEKKTADGETTSSCCRKRSIKDGQVVQGTGNQFRSSLSFWFEGETLTRHKKFVAVRFTLPAQVVRVSLSRLLWLPNLQSLIPVLILATDLELVYLLVVHFCTVATTAIRQRLVNVRGRYHEKP